MYYLTSYLSPIGEMTIAGDEKSIVGLWLEGQKYFAATIDDESVKKENLPHFIKTKHWLDDYFNNKEPKISALPLAPYGNDFRQAVWKILCEIPYGEVITYGDIAKKIALDRGKSKMSAQAVGGAVGHNPISIIIPCHRVVGSNGSLTGYAGGIDIKIKLLTHEGLDMSKFTVPNRGSAL